MARSLRQQRQIVAVTGGEVMPKQTNRAAPNRHETLDCLLTNCPTCGGPLWQGYHKQRTLVTLEGTLQLRLKVRTCRNLSCQLYHKAYRPEAEGCFALPHHEFGLDVIAQIGSWRYRDHLSVPEIHQHLVQHAVPIALRTVAHLLDRYDELVALSMLDPQRIRSITRG